MNEIRNKPFPIQGQRPVGPKSKERPPIRLPRTTISWEMAEIAYSSYIKRGGAGQSLERLAERGGFGLSELAFFLLGACGYQADPFSGTVRPPAKEKS